MAFGDVLVAKLTTPAWTPLFARAAAIVTDVGGPLSHGSIVAREYGIPAVLGTGNATQLIQDGQTITVDGLSFLASNSFPPCFEGHKIQFSRLRRHPLGNHPLPDVRCQ